MIEIPIRDLTRAQREKLQRGDPAIDELAEEIVAEEFGLEGLAMDADWWDVRHPDGAKYEVKSTATEVGDKYPSDGRFRVWKSQTRSLLASDARGTAWYTFVLLDEDSGSIKIQRRAPSTVSGLVGDRGGWNQSGHPMGAQHKIPWDEVVPR